jgi:hypothetical protein
MQAKKGRQPAPNVTNWKAKETGLLGTKPDMAVAKLLHRPLNNIISKRKELGIPEFVTQHRSTKRSGRAIQVNTLAQVLGPDYEGLSMPLSFRLPLRLIEAIDRIANRSGYSTNMWAAMALKGTVDMCEVEPGKAVTEPEVVAIARMFKFGTGKAMIDFVK